MRRSSFLPSRLPPYPIRFASVTWLLWLALAGACLPLAAQTHEPITAAPRADTSARDAVVAAAPAEPSRARGKRSLMGLVMDALIASAEQSAREQRASGLDAAPRHAPTTTVSRDEATVDAPREADTHKQVALQEP
ncbi:hypothetical protein ACFPN1_13200 [Lysobacter yangpyeongensis]|jgi:hypothetical protein|uniref:Secreted protein n=1 Tax=Lysobacter yangpyeongensis TaxID=346182 RepID=A0ABW0SR26_9GAMM